MSFLKKRKEYVENGKCAPYYLESKDSKSIFLFTFYPNVFLDKCKGDILLHGTRGSDGFVTR